MPKLYQYVGPDEIAVAVAAIPEGFPISESHDVMQWVKESAQEIGADGKVIASFIIDETGILRIADRCSEHVACAGGKHVQSAGEITFQFDREKITVFSVTNQSTGYCPEPESWPSVANALEKIGLPAPAEFSPAFEFRRCTNCDAINIIKDEIFECAICDSELSLFWNL